MNTELNFSEEDKQKVTEYLNMVAKYATLEMKTAELIQYYKLLHHLQVKIIPKIEANILEVKRVVESKEKASE